MGRKKRETEINTEIKIQNNETNKTESSSRRMRWSCLKTTIRCYHCERTAKRREEEGAVVEKGTKGKRKTGKERIERTCQTRKTKKKEEMDQHEKKKKKKKKKKK